MKKLKFTSLLLVFSLLFGILAYALPVFAEREDDAVIQVSALPEKSSVQVGDTVRFNISITGNDADEGINGYQFHIDYDSTRLQLTSVEFLRETNNYCAYYEDDTGVEVMWTSLSDYTGNNKLLWVEFTALQSGEATVTPSFSEGDCIYYATSSGEITDYAHTTVAGKVQVALNPENALTLSASDETGYDTVTVGITLSNAENIYGLQFELIYDKDKLEFVSVDINEQLLPYSFGVCHNAGAVRIAGATALATPLNGNNSIAFVTFRLTDPDRTAGTEYDLDFRFYLSSQPAYTLDEQKKTVNITEILTNSGTITVSASAVNPNDMDGNGKVDIADVTALLNYLSNPSSASLAPTANPDINGVGGADIGDVTALLNILSGK